MDPGPGRFSWSEAAIRWSLYYHVKDKDKRMRSVEVVYVCTKSIIVPWNEGRVGRGGVRETGKDMRGR